MGSYVNLANAENQSLTSLAGPGEVMMAENSLSTMPTIFVLAVT